VLRRSGFASFVYYLLVAGAVAGAGAGLFVLMNRRDAQAKDEGERRTTEVQAGPSVRATLARVSPTQRPVRVQAEARPFMSVTLYAKLSGYLRSIHVDKGDKVKKNQLLAVIGSPELDKQYLAALVDAKNKRIVARRAEKLAVPGVVSAQEAENARAAAEVADATVASIANQKGYELLRAPFDGTVTARFADPGALLQSATSAQSGALPVVTVSTLDKLRVYLYLDQRDASSVRVGDPAEITLDGRPDVKVATKVTRLAGELDPRTRMMLGEVEVPNPEGTIVPGSFVHARLTLTTPTRVEIPSDAVFVRDGQTLVAVVDDQEKIHLLKVRVLDDDARMAWVDGVSAGQKVVLDLGVEAVEGQKVRVVATTGEKK
jgi:RND family efflux transporter MFP subunit